MVPGVGCESCHGPGAQHIAAMGAGKKGARYIFNPRGLDPDTLSQEFCGSCHRSADAVGMMPNLGGINNVRFQPYRMALSRGHNSNDPRFACTACHDPHAQLNSEASSSYDSKCLECHAPSQPAHVTITNQEGAATKQSAAGRPCPVRNDNCVSCHMLKVDLPGAHFKFTDHRIRIARDGEPYPY